MRRRVVITGLGVVCAAGNDVKSAWEGVVNGKSFITKIPISRFDTSDFPTKIAGCVFDKEEKENGLDLDSFIPIKEQKKIDRFIQLALVAATQAVETSGIANLSEEKKLRVGVIVGSGIGGLSTISDTALILHEKGVRRVSPFFIPASLINLASGQISIQYGFKGPNHAVVTACSTGTHAIGDAAAIVGRGDADAMVAGGAEAAICSLGIAGFNAARALSTMYNDTPESASRPWDKGRDGFVMGEGAGILIVEELEHAKKRGATIYAEIVGYGMSGDAYHITAPTEDGDGAYRSMQMAAKNAQINPHEINYINAHGTSTPLGDVVEFIAVKNFLGKNPNTLMSSTKSSIGHLLGAAGAVEAIMTIKAMQENIAPPTINLNDPEEECKGIDLVPNLAKECKINYAMSNSFGFGGTNATLIFKKFY